MDTEMCVRLCQRGSRCCRMFGDCGGKVGASRQPPTVFVAVSLTMSTTKPCSVTSSALSAPSSE